MRDSSDGIIITKDEGVKTATPVEVKGQVSVNTFHWTAAQSNRTHGLADMPGLRSEAIRARAYNIDNDDKYLLGVVPEFHGLFEVLHHAYTYGAHSCLYLISSSNALLFIVLINFLSDLLKS